jgi:hypothetical protein
VHCTALQAAGRAHRACWLLVVSRQPDDAGCAADQTFWQVGAPSGVGEGVVRGLRHHRCCSAALGSACRHGCNHAQLRGVPGAGAPGPACAAGAAGRWPSRPPTAVPLRDEAGGERVYHGRGPVSTLPQASKKIVSRLRVTSAASASLLVTLHFGWNNSRPRCGRPYALVTRRQRCPKSGPRLPGAPRVAARSGE